MPTRKVRIPVTLDGELEDAVRFLVKSRRISKAKALLLIAQKGLEAIEDAALVKIAEERSKTPKSKFIPWEKFKKKVGLK